MASAEALVRDELGLTDDDIAAAYASARAAVFGPGASSERRPFFERASQSNSRH